MSGHDKPSGAIDRRAFLQLSLAASAASLLAACTSGATTPTPTPARPVATAGPAATTGPSPAAAKPAASPSAVAAVDAQAEWQRVQQAARGEGKLAIMGPAGDGPKTALVERVPQAFGLSVEMVSGPGRDLVPKMMTERGAGQYLWDLVITGTTSLLEDFQPAGVLDPLEPALILPDVKDGKNWRNGALEFVDPQRQVLVMTTRHRAVMFVNTNQTKPGDFASYRDVLDPKWKGKIVMDDPRRAGPGQASFTFFFLHPDLGPDYIRALGAQEPTLLRDFRQEADAVGQGRFPILIGCDEVIVGPLIESGAPIAIVEPPNIKERSDISAGVGTISLVNRAPHPNAAKVFINWLLSKEGQTEFVRNLGYISNRVDVPTDHAKPWQIPTAGAIGTYDRKAMGAKAPLLELLTQVFGPG